MIQECLEIFKKELSKYGDDLILSTYIPKDGTYLIINMNTQDNIDKWSLKLKLDIKYDKKTGKTAGKNDINYNLICFMDYYSKLIDMNKPIDVKKIIHSNNYMSFSIKKENLSNGKLTNEIIDKYYDILENPYLKYKTGNVKKLYKEVEEELEAVDLVILNNIKKWIKNNIFNICDDTDGKDYLKIFFVSDDEIITRRDFLREGKRYLIPNIYNNNKYNVIVGNEIYGMPNNNLQLNDKKHYLPNHSRRISTPYLINKEDVLLQAKFYDYLNGYASQGKYNIYFDIMDNNIHAYKSVWELESNFVGYYLRIRKGKNEAEIHHADTIVKFEPNLKNVFYLKEILPTKKHDKYGSYTNIKELEMLLDEIFFGKCLVSNYFTSVEDINIHDKSVVKELVAVRERLFTWFHKDNELDVKCMIRKTCLNLFKNSINQAYFNKAKEQLNFIWSLDDYFNNNKEAENNMNNIVSKVFCYIDTSDDWDFQSDDEYYFAVGQLLAYFIQKNKSSKIPMSLANPVLNAKKDSLIKSHLGNLFKKYNYDIWVTDIRVKNLYGHVMMYKPNGVINSEMISAGLVMDNLIYRKKEEN